MVYRTLPTVKIARTTLRAVRGARLRALHADNTAITPLLDIAHALAPAVAVATAAFEAGSSSVQTAT